MSSFGMMHIRMRFSRGFLVLRVGVKSILGCERFGKEAREGVRGRKEETWGYLSEEGTEMGMQEFQAGSGYFYIVR